VQGLVTFYTVFRIDLATRRVQLLGITPHPDEALMHQGERKTGSQNPCPNWCSGKHK